MTVGDRVKELQRMQRNHDVLYHGDILVLDTARRAKHMTLHNAKYTGRFLVASENNDTELFRRTLVDAFVISLATANIFADDMGAGLPVTDDKSDCLQHLGLVFAAETPNPQSFVCVYASNTSDMAKACESLDHLENFPFQRTLVEANRGIFKAILTEAVARNVDIETTYAERIADVEKNSPNNLFLEQN